MPLFGNKFSPKKSQPRKSTSLSNLNLDATERQAELGVDYGPIKLRLGSNEMFFSDGQWINDTSAGGSSQREAIRLKKENHQLKEENNLLKIKLELLLDMLSERTTEVQLQENEIEQLKRMAKKR